VAVLSGCDTSTECAEYLKTSVAEMRRGGGSGCFELSHVVAIARSPSATAPRIYVQDPKGGDFSAVRAKCDSTSAHACPEPIVSAVLSVVNGSAVTVRGYFHQGSSSGFEQMYLDDVVDEGTLSAVPEPRNVSLSDLSRGAQASASWFQIVTATAPEDAPLVMYDFSPEEFASAAPCPRWSGFAVIPRRAGAPLDPSIDCASGAENPPSRAHPDAREILVGREFFKEFFASTDCGCAAASKQQLLTASSQVVGDIAGVLVPEIEAGSSSIYQVFHPLSRARFPISGG
jgi:hypothetical protein